MMRKLILGWLVLSTAGFAHALVLDDYSTNLPLPYWTSMNWTNPVTAVVTESGLAGVVGGTRRIDVTGVYPSGTGGVQFGFISQNIFDVSSSNTAYTDVVLSYNANGAGLSLDISTGTKFQVNIGMSTANQGPDIVLEVSVSDGSTTGINSKTWTTPYSPPAGPLTLDFLFSDFTNSASIDWSSISSLTLHLETGVGGDESFYSFTTDANPPAVPEPATLTLLGIGLLGLVGVVRRSKGARQGEATTAA